MIKIEQRTDNQRRYAVEKHRRLEAYMKKVKEKIKHQDEEKNQFYSQEAYQESMRERKVVQVGLDYPLSYYELASQSIKGTMRNPFTNEYVMWNEKMIQTWSP